MPARGSKFVGTVAEIETSASSSMKRTRGSRLIAFARPSGIITAKPLSADVQTA
jgi:hypothetical protein